MAKPRIAIEDVKPIAEQFPRSEGDALVFDLGTREVVVEGDPSLVQATLARCNGRATVAQIAAEVAGGGPGDASAGAAEEGTSPSAKDVRDLIEALLSSEVVTDCSQHWRHFHRLSCIDAGIVRELAEEDVVALEAERFSPTQLAGRAETLQPRRTALWELCGRRSSSLPEGGARSVEFDELSTILSAVYGRSPGGHHPIPSGGGIYPLVIHVALRTELAGKPPGSPPQPGLWWYDPDRFELRLVRDHSVDLEGLFLAQPISDEILSYGHPIVFVSADLERPSRKYSGRGYRFALMEAGAALQSVYLAGTELGLPVRALGGLLDGPVGGFLELPPDCHPLLAVLLGN